MNPKELISQIKDYADIADASYAMLDLIDENDEKGFFDSAFTPPLWLYADGIKLGYEIEEKFEFLDKNGKFQVVKDKGDLTAYACAIQARFEQNKIVKIEPKYCISLINTCFDSKEITLDNDISRVGLNDALSKRTIDFVNRFKILKH
ncbi:methyltransferase [Campylobacter insulaenigrae]|uniref:methyltransferase n=1 Tax=Campylobacter insulaenigrae TaxID=260714 RepID=UPI0021520A88|nr:methyltransferase [Campylobacter insulaenigrae]MCR6574910.1 methyltransferase [Campylobacter insulaenigrae]